MRLLIIALLIGLPLAEIFVFILVGEAIGAGPTVALVALAALAGAAILRHQGFAVGRRLHAAVERGELPVAAAFDGACIFLAGLLLIVPGFITDLVAMLLLVPALRGLLRAGLAALLAGKIQTRIYTRTRTIEGEYREVDGEVLPPRRDKEPD